MDADQEKRLEIIERIYQLQKTECDNCDKKSAGHHKVCKGCKVFNELRAKGHELDLIARTRRKRNK